MMTSGSSEKDRLYDLGQVLASPAGRAPVAKDYVECCQIGRFSDVVVFQVVRGLLKGQWSDHKQTASTGTLFR